MTTRTAYEQMTTGRIHKSRTCGVVRRTRYEPLPVQVRVPVPADRACRRCWRTDEVSA